MKHLWDKIKAWLDSVFFYEQEVSINTPSSPDNHTHNFFSHVSNNGEQNIPSSFNKTTNNSFKAAADGLPIDGLNNPIQTEIKTGIEHQRVIKNLAKQRNKHNLSHLEVINIIQMNIFYLQKLSNAMSKSIYIMEYEKVNQLLAQSENCLKLMKHINQSQIFYQNTTSFVIAHAIQVGELTEHLKNVEL